MYIRAKVTVSTEVDVYLVNVHENDFIMQFMIFMLQYCKSMTFYFSNKLHVTIKYQ